MFEKTNTPKNVALFVQKPSNIYSNGCYQQAMYMATAIKNSGHNVFFVSADPSYKVFEPYGHEIKTLFLTDDLSWMDVIVFASAILAEKAFITLMKIHGVKICAMVCGNLYTLHQEEFIFGVHNIFRDYLLDAVDEVWLMPMYEYAKEYLEVMMGKPVKMIKYVWDTDLMEHAKKEAKVPLEYIPATSSAEMDVAIFEPNLSQHKSSLCPFLCANDLEREDPTIINSIHAFCMLGEEGNPEQERRTEHRKEMLSNLLINKKSNLYRRITLPSILEWFRTNKPNGNLVALTHNDRNNLNFLHLELMYLGYPVIHNCPKFQNGLFYDDWCFQDCKEIIKKAKSIDTWYEEYKKKCHEIVESFRPTNPEIVHAYRDIVDTLCKEPKTISVHQKTRDLIVRLAKEVRETNTEYTAKSLPVGIIICSSNELRTQDLVKNIRGLSQRLPIEVYIPKDSPSYSFQDPTIVVKNGQYIEHWRNVAYAGLTTGFENFIIMDDLTRFLNNPELYFQFEQLQTHGNIVWSSSFGYKENDSTTVCNGQDYAARWFISIYYGMMFKNGDKEVSSNLFVMNGKKCHKMLQIWKILLNSGMYFQDMGFTNGRELIKLAYYLSGTVMFLNNITPFAISSFGSNDLANILLYQVVEKVGGHYSVIPVQVPNKENNTWNLLETDASTQWEEQKDGLLKLSKVKSVAKMNTTN